MKRIAVAGGSGFIGRALVEELSKDPRNAVMWSMSREHCDLRLPMHCEQFVRRADVVYMCAGVTGGSGLIASDPLSLVTPNVQMHLNLFDACLKAGVKKVICLSSTTGYPDTDLPMSEEDYFAGEPHPAYFNPGHARRFIERLGLMYPLNIVFLRPSVVYGPCDNFDPETSHVIPALVRKVAERQDPITIWGDGSNWRDAVYIDDVVRALLLAADAPAGAYNIASGEGMIVQEMLATLIAAWPYRGSYPEIKYDPSKPSMLKKRVLNIDKANRVMGWWPTVRIKYGLRRTLDWYADRR